MKYRYTLEKYSGSKSRFKCPECGKNQTFTKYIDTEKYEYIGDDVGRCNREVKCGYHKGPKSLNLSDYSSYKPKLIDIHLKETFYHKTEHVERTFEYPEENKFVQFLLDRFKVQEVEDIISDYRIGTTSKTWEGSTIFWQVDHTNKVRTGKIMVYEPTTGKREKKISYTHTGLKTENEELRQCLFGLHLINKYPDKKIGIVESEKTAIICSIYLKDYIWMATSGLSNLNENKLLPIKDKKIELFPDLNAYNKWKKKVDEFKFIKNVTVNNLLENAANEAEKEKGYDLADYFLMKYS